MIKPTVGEIVHYVSYGTPGGEYRSECRAAIVTEVNQVPTGPHGEWLICLCVINPTGLFFNRGLSSTKATWVTTTLGPRFRLGRIVGAPGTGPSAKADLMYVTALNAGLLAVVAFATGILTGAGLVAVALARREASLNLWAAQLLCRDFPAATNPVPEPVAFAPASPIATGSGTQGSRWPVLPDTLRFDTLASFLVSTGQPWPVPDTWR
jgi:hypothetical protein